MRNGYPFIDLHRHLEGWVRPATILDLARQHDLPLPASTVEGLRAEIEVSAPVADIMTYIAKFELMQHSMVDADAIRRITYECFEDAAREGIDYLELRFSPLFMAEKHSLDLDLVVEATCDGLREATSALDIRANLIGIMSRTYGPDACWRELHAVLRGQDRGVVAVDLAGDEANYPGALFVDHFKQARDAGMRITVHAGEAGPAEFVQQAIEELGAERIGHGVHAADDPAVIDLILEKGIAIESCPTSNIHTCVVSGYADHPLPDYLWAGVRVTVNTDNGTISAIDLPSEYKTLATETDLSEAEFRQLQENALRAAFMSEDMRSDLLQASGA